MIMDSSRVQTLVSRLNELTEKDMESIDARVCVISTESGLIFPKPPETPEHNKLVILRNAKGYTIKAGTRSYYNSEINFAPLGRWEIVDGCISVKTNRIFEVIDDTLNIFTGNYEVIIEKHQYPANFSILMFCCGMFID